MIEALTLITALIAVDIRSQWVVMRDKQATEAQVEQAAERLCCYGELSYKQLKDKVTGVAERRCQQRVWPRVLAPRTKLLIDDLSSNQFIVRQRASQELEEIGRYNRVLILQAVGQSKDLEQLQRLNRLLDTIPLRE